MLEVAADVLKILEALLVLVVLVVVALAVYTMEMELQAVLIQAEVAEAPVMLVIHQVLVVLV
jgi:hypothetical protein